MKNLINFILIFTLNIWFYFWAPFVLFFSLLIYTPYVAFFRIFQPAKTMFHFRKSINLYGKSVGLTAWPWIKIKLHNSPPGDGAPYIFVENHTSSFDPFLQGFLPFELVQAARDWALRLPVLGIVAKFAGYLDVNSLPGKKLVKSAENRIRNGISVVFFPEGTRYPYDNMGPFHSTAFRVAFETETAVVPVIIKGVDNKPKKGSLLMHPGRIDIYCLPVIDPKEFKATSHMALKKLVRNKMEEKKKMLSGKHKQ